MNNIDRIVMECVREDDGTLIAWEIRVIGTQTTIAIGSAASLSQAIDMAIEYTKREKEGDASRGEPA